MVNTGPLYGQHVVSTRMIPPPLAVRPELTDDDVAWLNRHLELVDRPPVRYARTLPPPPPPSGTRPPVDASWITTTWVRDH